MILKKNLDISTDDFFYDLFDGGSIKPGEILESVVDIKQVEDAIKVLSDFKSSCEEQIDEFYR